MKTKPHVQNATDGEGAAALSPEETLRVAQEIAWRKRNEPSYRRPRPHGWSPEGEAHKRRLVAERDAQYNSGTRGPSWLERSIETNHARNGRKR
jgi:hypothetical protein